MVDLTVPARLHGGLDVADALDGDAVLIVAVDKEVLELADLVDQDAELVRHIRHVLVAGLTPDGELLLKSKLACACISGDHCEVIDIQQPPCALGQRAPCCA